MITGLGAILVVGGCMSIGFSAIARLSGKIKIITCWIHAIEYLQNEISFSLRPLPEIIARIDIPALNCFFSDLLEGWDPWGDKSYAQVWCESLKLLDLREKDYCIISELGKILGRYDASRQELNMSYIRKRLELSLTELIVSKSKMGRVYGVLGFVCGLVLTLILI